MELKEKQKIKREIIDLKKKLNETDYKVLKFFEGQLSQQEFDQLRIERQQSRDKINELENIIK